MIPALLRRPLRLARNAWRRLQAQRRIERRRHRSGREREFDFAVFRSATLGFVDAMRVDAEGIRHRFAASCPEASLYASAYACMTRSLLGDLARMNAAARAAWVAYFDNHQDADTGLFRDPAVANSIYDNSDWWGARHLALHLISAYTDLGHRPAHPFGFLSEYYAPGAIPAWLDRFDWTGSSIGDGDIDNKIMNVGCLLQFQRDKWNDAAAARALAELRTFLRARANPRTGLWGGFDPDDPGQRSRLVQFAYHLLPLFFYDGDHDFPAERIAELVLRTQNANGGYGVSPNSSACEDIDSADLLIRLAPRVSSGLRLRIDASVRRALAWTLLNQVEDGGFVFRLDEALDYGSANTSSVANSGAMLPTWFRSLAAAYMARHLGLPNGFVITSCPGYEF